MINTVQVKYKFLSDQQKQTVHLAIVEQQVYLRQEIVLYI